MRTKKMMMLVGLTIVLGVTGTLMTFKFTPQPKQAEAMLNLEDTIPPVIVGQRNLTVEKGETINILQGVKTLDDKDQLIRLSASMYSTEKEGQQDIVITAKDSSNNQTEETVKLTVIARKEEKPSPSTTKKEKTKETSPQKKEPPPTNEPSPTETSETTNQTQETPETKTTTQQKTKPVGWQSNMMYIGELVIPYYNAGQGSGQSVIDNNPNVVATWGGAPIQSGTDGSNTHFIGHNPGIFSVITQIGIGNQIVVTDSNAIPTYYNVREIFQVDDQAMGVYDGQDYWDYITGVGGEERMTMQTCLSDTINLIVVAYP